MKVLHPQYRIMLIKFFRVSDIVHKIKLYDLIWYRKIIRDMKPIICTARNLTIQKIITITCICTVLVAVSKGGGLI